MFEKFDECPECIVRRVDPEQNDGVSVEIQRCDLHLPDDSRKEDSGETHE